VNIRSISPEEIPLIVPGGRAFFSEGAMPGSFNEPHFTAFMQNLMTSNIGFILTAFTDAGGFAGAIGGTCFPDFATGDLTATEFFWYVLPEHRMVGVRLLNAFEAEATRRGCVRIHMIHLANQSGEKLDAFYARRGYRYLEKVFTKELAC